MSIMSKFHTGLRVKCDMSGVASKAFWTPIENNIPFYQTTFELSISYVIDDL